MPFRWISETLSQEAYKEVALCMTRRTFEGGAEGAAEENEQKLD